jgi:uncharacterized membrane protein
MVTHCGTVTTTSPFNANNVYVSGCNLQTTSVTTGESVNVTVPVNNDNGSRAVTDIALNINGQQVEVKNVLINANDSGTFSFEFTPDSPGDYSVTVEVASVEKF